MKLRGYQNRTILSIDREHEKGARAILVAAPTGAGKGTMAAHLLARHAARGERGLFVVHRREIVDDQAARLLALGVKPGRVYVTTVQAMVHDGISGRYDFMVMDEAHHYAENEWADAVDSVKAGWRVGFTATPSRADGRPLGMFDAIVEAVKYSELLRDGYIVPTRVLRPPTALGADLAQEPAEAYLRYVDGAKAFIFVGSVDLAELTAASLTRRGRQARVIHAKTPLGERARHVEDLKSGKIRAIVNVDTMTEGVDVPSVNAIVLGRTCRAASTYLQAAGRGMRPDGEKTRCDLLDLTGASFQHGRPDVDRVYSLSGSHAIGFALQPGEEIVRRRETLERKETEIVGMDLVEYTDDDQQRHGVRVINWLTAGLGKEPDQAIADRLGVSESTVLLARQRFGIAMFRRIIDWNAVEFDARDEVVAERLGCSRITVAHARKKRGIPMPGSRSKQGIDWSKVALGEKTDAAIAAELGCSLQSVYYARKKKGIEAKTFREIAERGGHVPTHRGGAAKKLDFSRQPLGEMPDARIAAKMGCSERSVKMARQTLGIPAFNPGSWRKIDWKGAPFGKKPDVAIARQFKCSEHAVWKERTARGIAAYAPQKGTRRKGPIRRVAEAAE